MRSEILIRLRPINERVQIKAISEGSAAVYESAIPRFSRCYFAKDPVEKNTIGFSGNASLKRR